MAPHHPNRQLAELEISEPLIISDADVAAEADIDAHQLRTYLDNSKASRRRRYTSLLVGIISLLILVGIFVQLSGRHLVVIEKPVVSHLEPHFFPEHKSERVQIRYGPFRVPGSGQDNGMKSFKTRDAKAPCNDCMILWMQAGLEFEAGAYAGVKEGMWLHHTVLQNNRKNGLRTCSKEGKERFFASGNERTVLDLSANGTQKIGYLFGEEDTISMATELMNAHEEERTAVLTITYEYIPYRALDFSTTTPIWLDIGGCHSDVPVPSDKTSFELASPAWTSSINGRVVTVVSHLHDGGIHLQLQRDGKEVCNSKAEYGMTTKFESHTHDMDMSHITRMSECYGGCRMSVGEEWTVKAHYDLEKHEPMMGHHGEPEPVMGITVVYVVED